MLAECPWCGKRFETDHGGRQHCPHCWAELELPEEPAKTTIPPPEAKEGEGFSPLGPWEQTSSVSAQQTWVGAGGEAPPAPAPRGETSPPLEPAPWERGEGGLFKSFWETWKGAALNPNRFFARLGPHESYWPAVGFVVLIAGMVALADVIWAGVGLPDFLFQQRPGEQFAAAFGLFFTVLFTPLAVLVRAAAVHVCLRILGAASLGFGTTFRAVCYAYAPGLLGVFPGGWFLAWIWELAVEVVGIRWTQGTSTSEAVLAVVVIPLAALFFVAVVAAIVIFGIVAAAG